MPVGTRTVFALIGGAVLTIGVLLHASDREGAGLAAFAVGCLFACGWAFLGMDLARRGLASAPAETYLSGGMAALVMTIYFGFRAKEALFSRE